MGDLRSPTISPMAPHLHPPVQNSRPKSYSIDSILGDIVNKNKSPNSNGSDVIREDEVTDMIHDQGKVAHLYIRTL